jgi:hypothetical protein
MGSSAYFVDLRWGCKMARSSEGPASEKASAGSAFQKSSEGPDFVQELLPDDATIQEVAEVFAVTERLHLLTPAARKLTKGQMVAGLGAESVPVAALRVVTNLVPDEANIRARTTGDTLSVDDVQSVQRVFGGDAFPREDKAFFMASLAAASGVAGGRARPPDGGGTSIYLCCCPCCCATAVLDPVGPTVA